MPPHNPFIITIMLVVLASFVPESLARSPNPFNYTGAKATEDSTGRRRLSGAGLGIRASRAKFHELRIGAKEYTPSPECESSPFSLWRLDPGSSDVDVTEVVEKALMFSTLTYDLVKTDRTQLSKAQAAKIVRIDDDGDGKEDMVCDSKCPLKGNNYTKGARRTLALAPPLDLDSAAAATEPGLPGPLSEHALLVVLEALAGLAETDEVSSLTQWTCCPLTDAKGNELKITSEMKVVSVHPATKVREAYGLLSERLGLDAFGLLGTNSTQDSLDAKCAAESLVGTTLTLSFTHPVYNAHGLLFSAFVR